MGGLLTKGDDVGRTRRRAEEGSLVAELLNALECLRDTLLGVRGDLRVKGISDALPHH